MVSRWRKRKGVAKVALQDGAIRLAEIHWYEATGVGRREFKIKRYLDYIRTMASTRTLLLCLRNSGYEVSLEPRKLYPAIPDRSAAVHGQVRVIDESGEAYLYPKTLFAPVSLPPALRRAVFAAV